MASAVGSPLDAARRRYRRLAAAYDLDPDQRFLYARARARGVAAAALPGSAVLDVAYGTGHSFPLIGHRHNNPRVVVGRFLVRW